MKHQALRKLFLAYVIPTVIAMFISGAYQLVDGVFIGNVVGLDGLAAANIGWSYIAILLGFGFLVGVGIGSHYSLAVGRDDDERALRVLGQSLFLMVVPGGLLGALLYYYAPVLVAIPNAGVEASRMAIDFLRVFALATPMVVGSIAMPFIVRNVDTPMRAMVYMSIGIFFNILFSFLLIVYWEKGLWGAAIASVIGESVAMVLGANYLLKQSQAGLRWRHFIPRMNLLKAITMNGSSAFFMYIYLSAIIVLHHIQLETYGGTIAIAAYTITGYLLTIIYLISEGVANGVQPLLSQLYGAKRINTMRSMTRMMILSISAVGIGFTLLLQLFPNYFAWLFIAEDAELTTLAIHAIRLNLSVLFLEGLFVVAIVFFQSIGEGHKALFIALGNIVIQVPFLFILPKYWGLNGVWLTMPLATIILSIPICYLFYRRYKTLFIVVSK